MASQNKDEAKLPILKGGFEAWPLWKRRVRAHLMSNQQMRVIIEGAEQNKDLPEEKHNKFVNMKNTSGKVYAKLINQVADENQFVFDEVDDMDGAGAWLALLNYFEEQTELHIMQLEEELDNVRQTEGETLSSYFHRVHMIMTLMKSLGTIFTPPHNSTNTPG